MTTLTIALGNDHGGLALRAPLIEALEKAGHRVRDFGTAEGASVDYPDFAHQVCAAVERGQAAYGLLICGTGIGMSIAANRHPGIRAAVLHSATEARLTRAHNNANIACFGARMTGVEVALEALSTFLATPYEGGRHDRRIAKLSPAEVTP
jgi:ribose 5-phosphate isomerase B